MKKYLFILTVFIVIVNTGCVSTIREDDKIRITGIVDACKKSPEKMELYLNKKVEKKEISETVSYTIKECLK